MKIRSWERGRPARRMCHLARCARDARAPRPRLRIFIRCDESPRIHERCHENTVGRRQTAGVAPAARPVCLSAETERGLFELRPAPRRTRTLPGTSLPSAAPPKAASFSSGVVNPRIHEHCYQARNVQRRDTPRDGLRLIISPVVTTDTHLGDGPSENDGVPGIGPAVKNPDRRPEQSRGLPEHVPERAPAGQ